MPMRQGFLVLSTFPPRVCGIVLEYLHSLDRSRRPSPLELMLFRIADQMRIMMQKTITFFAVLGSLLGGVGHAAASNITYTEQAVGTGRLGADSFTNALVTITFAGDTANILNYSPGVLVNSVGTALVSVSGVGTASFTDTLAVFDNQPEQAFGIVDLTVSADVLYLQNPAFATYDLRTSLGPVSGPSSVNAEDTFNTTRGGFSLTAAGDVTVTASTVPEPSSLLLLSLGLAGVVRWRGKRYGAASSTVA